MKRSSGLAEPEPHSVVTKIKRELTWSPYCLTGAYQWLARGKKVKSRREREIWKQFLQFREEKEKSEFPFHSFERRKRNLNFLSTGFERRQRNLNFLSPVSRGEREIWISFPQIREEKEKSEFPFHSFERRKRNLNFLSTVSRREREIWNSFPQFREEKEKSDALTFRWRGRNSKQNSSYPLHKVSRSPTHQQLCRDSRTTRNRKQNLIYREEKEKISWKSRREREFHYQNLIIERRKRNLSPKSRKSRGEGEICLRYLENREEIEKFVSHILKIEKRKRKFSKKSWKSRGEREFQYKKSQETRGEREFPPQNLENREENETWKFTSPARARKLWVISLREFLEIVTLVKAWIQLILARCCLVPNW